MLNMAGWWGVAGAHLEAIDFVIDQALQKAGLRLLILTRLRPLQAPA